MLCLIFIGGVAVGVYAMGLITEIVDKGVK